MIHVDGVLPAEPSAGLQRAADLTLYLLHKLRAGWNEVACGARAPLATRWPPKPRRCKTPCAPACA